MASLPDKVIAIHEALDQASIPHAFGGALALIYAIQRPRGTDDIDVNVFVAPEQAATVFRALPAGVQWDNRVIKQAARDGQIRVFWDQTPVDLFFSYHQFHEVAARRAALKPFADRQIPVLSPTDLVVFKAFFSRTKDWADIEAIASAGSADMDEALHWVRELLGTDSSNYEQLARRAQGSGPEGSGPEDEMVIARRLRHRRAP